MPARPRPPHLSLGQAGEDAAARFLEERGCRILDRNWRHGGLELDLVVEEAGVIVFVEVRTRRHAHRGRPEETLGPRKRASLLRAAQAWLSCRDAWSRPCRFDVLALVARPADHPDARQDADTACFQVERLEHALEMPHAVDRGHAHWQPW